MFPDVRAGWAVLTLVNGRVIAGWVENQPDSGGLRVYAGKPYRSYTFAAMEAVRTIRPCSEEEALALQSEITVADPPGSERGAGAAGTLSAQGNRPPSHSPPRPIAPDDPSIDP
jgi:hypothetical protein